MLYRHCLSPRWVCRERETHTYNKARWWLWISSDLIKGALWLARTLDYKTDFVWSANMYLEGGAAPDNMILSSVQGAHSNLHCRIDFYTVEAGCLGVVCLGCRMSCVSGVLGVVCLGCQVSRMFHVLGVSCSMCWKGVRLANLFKMLKGRTSCQRSFKIASLHAACVITEAPGITYSRHATSLHAECRL